MLIRHTAMVLAGLAVSASLFGCAHQTNAVSDAAASSAQAVGARLAEQDRADAARHRAEIEKLVRVDRLAVREADRTLTIAFVMRNLTRKPITRTELAFESDSPDGARIGTAELHANVAVGGGQTKSIVLVVPYVQFGSDTGAMREALGKPQRFAVDVKEIKYADGTDAGYDD